MRKLLGGIASLALFCGAASHVANSRNERPVAQPIDNFADLTHRANALYPRLELLDETLEAARPKVRPIPRARAKAEHIRSNYVSEFLVQYLADFDSCFSELPKNASTNGRVLRETDMKSGPWPLDGGKSAGQLTEAEIAEALGSKIFQIRRQASLFLTAHGEVLSAKMEALLKQKIDPEVRWRLAQILAPYQAKEKLKICVARAEEKYVTKLAQEAHPDSKGEECESVGEREK